MVISVHVYTRLCFVYFDLQNRRFCLWLFFMCDAEKLLFIGFLHFQAPPLELSPWKHHTN